MRVLLDPALSCAPSAKIFRDSGVVVYAAADTPEPRGGKIAVERVARSGKGLDLNAVLGRLAQREVNELWVEAGPRLAGSLIDAALVDELVLYIAPVLFGAGARPLSDIATVGSIEAAPRFHFCEQRRFGADLRVILKPGPDPVAAGVS